MVTKEHHLVKLVKLVNEVYHESPCDSTAPGRPPLYTPHMMLKVYLVMMVKKIKTYQALHRYLRQNPKLLQACGLRSVPSRRTLSRRLKSFSPGVADADPRSGQADNRRGNRQSKGNGDG